jgi:hypothetical protein
VKLVEVVVLTVLVLAADPAALFVELEFALIVVGVTVLVCVLFTVLLTFFVVSVALVVGVEFWSVTLAKLLLVVVFV